MQMCMIKFVLIQQGRITEENRHDRGNNIKSIARNHNTVQVALSATAATPFSSSLDQVFYTSGDSFIAYKLFCFTFMFLNLF